jgi:hypothetical protein
MEQRRQASLDRLMSTDERRGQKVPERPGVVQSENYLSGGVFYVDLNDWRGGWVACEYEDAVEVER